MKYSWWIGPLGLVGVLAILGLSGCTTPEACCCCYHINAGMSGECGIWTAEELGATVQNPCGDPDSYPEGAFICGYSEETMNVADQFQAVADACVADLEGD